MRGVGALISIALLVACKSDEESEPAAVACATEDVRVAGACVATGVPPERCGAGLRADARGCVADMQACAPGSIVAVGGCMPVGIAA